MKRKIISALLSLAAAFALWTYVITVVGPEYEVAFTNVEVNIERVLENRDLMILLENNPKVTVRLSGNRLDLNKLDKSDISVAVNLSNITGARDVTLNFEPPSLGGNISASVEPASITLKVVDWKQTDVPVEVEVEGELRENYFPEKPEDMQVQISGPAEVIDRIGYAQLTLTVDETVTTDITQQVSYILYDKKDQPLNEGDLQYLLRDGQTQLSEPITLTVPIMRRMVLPLNLNVLPGGGATAQNVTIEPAEITVSGSDEVLRELTQLELGVLDLSKKTDTQDVLYDIVLPEGIKNESGEQQATVKVAFGGLALRTFTVVAEDIDFIHVPSGMIPSISIKRIQITVRGAEAAVAALTEEDIKVQVDFTDAKQGDQRLDVVVTIAGGGNVGVIGEYSVLAQLKADE